MELKSFKIGKYTIEKPIVQGGMGVGISWDRLAGNVSKEGALGVISSVGTGVYKNREFTAHVAKNGQPIEADNFYSGEVLKVIFENARKICGDKPLACNVLYASSDYDRIVKDACEAGADMIITGAGLPLTMPEAAKEYPDVALIPIVSTAKALRILCRRWKKTHNRLPDAVIVEGPLSGGHQGFKYEECFLPENQLEVILPPVIEEAKNWGSMPVIAAGGIWDHDDIVKMMELGADAVQMGTRFIGTFECDAHENFKQVILDPKKENNNIINTP